MMKRLILLLLLVLPSLGFKSRYHEEFTREALKDVTRTIGGRTLRFSNLAIDQIVRNNVDQDRGWCVLGAHPECPSCGIPSAPFAVSANHFDGEELTEGSAVLQERMRHVVHSLGQPIDAESARRWLGQMLHATQDYYAHSNWAETNGVPDDRLGSSTFSAVPSTTPTCEAPPNTDRYLPSFTSGLTTGYWYGCLGRDDSKLPPNKCYHGLEVSTVVDFISGKEHAGTNKDSPSRPHFDAASMLATQSSTDLVDKLLDAEGVRNNLQATAALMGITTVAFVIDVKNQVEFGGLKRGIGAVIAAIEQQGSGAHEYMSVVYGMGFPSIRWPEGSIDGEPFATTDPAAFMADLEENVIWTGSAYGPYSCGTNSESALLRAVNASLPGSQVFLITDEQALESPGSCDTEAECYQQRRDDASRRGEEINARAKARGIKIIPLLTGTCSPIDPILRSHAAQTGGEIFLEQVPLLWSRDPAAQAMSEHFVSAAVPSQVDARMVDLALLTGEDVPTVMLVTVDATMSQVIFAATGDYPSSDHTKMLVRRPDFNYVDASDPGVTVVEFSGSITVTVDAPSAGTWRVYLRPETRSASVKAVSDERVELDFVEHGNAAHPGFYPIEGSPVQNQPATIAVHTSESSVQLDAVDPETGALLGSLGTALPHPDGGALVSSTQGLPATDFRIRMQGKRVVPRIFQPQPISVAPWNNQDVVLENQSARVGFVVRNKGLSTMTLDLSADANYSFPGHWTVDAYGRTTYPWVPGPSFIEGVSPATLTLASDASELVFVDLRPAPAPKGAPLAVTLLARAQGQLNSSTVYLPEPSRTVQQAAALGMLLFLCSVLRDRRS